VKNKRDASTSSSVAAPKAPFLSSHCSYGLRKPEEKAKK